MPGTDDDAFTETVRTVWGVLEAPVGAPFIPELPGRGPAASMTGRALAVMADLSADLQPDGWRLTGTGAASGVDHRRARSLLAQDLDTVEELTQGWGPGLNDPVLKTQVCGPWTLAATVEKPRGDKVLSDHGARRELAQALAEGIGDHVADLRRRVPGADRLVVQLDEPALGAVLRGQVPTASGFGRHRSIDRPELGTTLTSVIDAVTAAGAECWVHSCAPETPWELVTASGLLLDLAVTTPAELEVVAAALEAGRTVGLGMLPGTDPEPAAAAELASDRSTITRVLRLLDMLGLDPERYSDQIVVTPACGSAGATAGWARQVLALSRSVAANL